MNKVLKITFCSLKFVYQKAGYYLNQTKKYFSRFYFGLKFTAFAIIFCLIEFFITQRKLEEG